LDRLVGWLDFGWVFGWLVGWLVTWCVFIQLVDQQGYPFLCNVSESWQPRQGKHESPGLLRSEWRQFLTDVSGQPISPILRVQGFKKNCYALRNSPEECSYHLLRNGSLKSRMNYSACTTVYHIFEYSVVV
jgi:hypothetical protein